MEKVFNFACAGVCIQFPEDEPSKVLVVDYWNEKGETEARFPTGSVRFSHIYYAVEKFIDSREFTNVNDPIFWSLGKIKSCEDQFKSKANVQMSRHERNMFLDGLLWQILGDLNECHLNESDFNEILLNSRLTTLHNELVEETNAYEIGNFVQTSSSLLGNHERCGFVSVDTKAPDLFSGSGDADIARSYWILVEEVERKISFKHLNYFYSAIRKVVDEKLHPRADELIQFCAATNH